MQKNHATFETQTAPQRCVCQIEQGNHQHAQKGRTIHRLWIPFPEDYLRFDLQERL